MDSSAKYLLQHFPVTLVQSLRFGVNLVLVLLLFWRSEGTRLFVIQRKWLVLLRSAALFLGSLAASLALRLMPVAETAALVYLAPFGVLLLSEPLLGEKVRWFGWVATAIAFVGLIFIVRPGSGLAPMGVVFALLCACCTVVYHALSRLLAKTETTQALLFYSALAGTLFFVAQLPWRFALPAVITPVDYILLALIGCFGTLGHLLFTSAYRDAPLSLLTPVNYMQIAWAIVLGWLIFGHLPDALTFMGIAMVAFSGAGNALLTHMANSRAAALEPEEV